jgi:hypothetical protein
MCRLKRTPLVLYQRVCSRVLIEHNNQASWNSKSPQPTASSMDLVYACVFPQTVEVAASSRSAFRYRDPMLARAATGRILTPQNLAGNEESLQC